MREILFRGKRVDNGEWAKGFYTASPTGNHYITRIGAMGCANLDKVDPVTVGQYIGLTDKNGKQIFEGDIVKMKAPKFSISGYGAVIFRNSVFCIEDKKRRRFYDLSGTPDEYCVVGNIYDKEATNGNHTD